MATGEVHERLEKCFKGLAAGDWSQLDMHFMKRTLHLFNQNVENKQQDSLHNLTSFLQLCEKGRWNDAKLSFKEAKKEYENYVKTKLSQYPAQGSTAETRELSHEKHSNKEVEETQLMRRSKDASIRLMDNNPNISDLSDPNRPIKLAERFSELYSNAYTDAFEELNGKNSNPAKSIKDLLNIVKDAHVFCKGRRKQIIDNQMTSTGSSPDDPAKRYDSMIKLREAAEKALPTVRKDFMKNRTNDMRVRTQKFAEECVEIVWLMCIQQPPVHLEWVENEREKFNQDLYRGYTRSGEVIEFCVWPVVRLHEKGPILTRGIAQGCD